MRPYENYKMIEWPDVADLLYDGRPSRFLKMTVKSRQSARRLHRKRDRKKSNNECKVRIEELFV